MLVRIMLESVHQPAKKWPVEKMTYHQQQVGSNRSIPKLRFVAKIQVEPRLSVASTKPKSTVFGLIYPISTRSSTKNIIPSGKQPHNYGKWTCY